MATVGAVCNMQTNMLCLSLVDVNIFYYYVQVQREHTSYIELGDDPRFIVTCYLDYGHDDDEVSINTHAALIDTTPIAEKLVAMMFEAATTPPISTPSRCEVLAPDEYGVYRDQWGNAKAQDGRIMCPSMT